MSTALSMTPSTASDDTGVKAPSETRVAGLATMMPEFFRPMKAMKKPMPAEMAKRSVVGMQCTICSRTLKAVSKMKITPSTKTAASAVCQL